MKPSVKITDLSKEELLSFIENNCYQISMDVKITEITCSCGSCNKTLLDKDSFTYICDECRELLEAEENDAVDLCACGQYPENCECEFK
jgi:hypothetical protein